MAREAAGFHLHLVPFERKEEFRSVFQAYAAELAPFTGAKPVGGVYPYLYFDVYWTETDSRWPYWLLGQDGEVAGFALVHFNDDKVFYVAEFYVLPTWRKQGVGTLLMEELLLRHQGTWRLRYIQGYAGAEAFWTKVVGNRPGCSAKAVVQNDIPRMELNFEQVGA